MLKKYIIICDLVWQLSLYNRYQIQMNLNQPDNYHLTLSYSGWNWDVCKDMLNKGVNVAMVFNYDKHAALPATYGGYPVINGDITDLRVDEAKGIIVGLHWKTIADKTLNAAVRFSTFAVQPHDENINQ